MFLFVCAHWAADASFSDDMKEILSLLNQFAVTHERTAKLDLAYRMVAGMANYAYQDLDIDVICAELGRETFLSNKRFKRCAISYYTNLDEIDSGWLWGNISHGHPASAL